MLTVGELYNVLSALVPLYVAVFTAYASVRWWKIFTPDHCAGINRFVAMLAVPLLNFEFISRIDVTTMNVPFVSADTLSKIFILSLLFLWLNYSEKASLDWVITLFSLSTLPNTLLMGVPLLKAMYGDQQEGLMVQLVVLQSFVWYTFLIFLFEYRAAKVVFAKQTSVIKAVEESNGVVDVVVDASAAAAAIDDKSNEAGVSEPLLLQTRVEMKKNIGMRSILKMVWFKLTRNPNFYASVLGLSWSLAASSLKFQKPLILEKSVTILSDCALGMAMFSLGSFMALQPRIVSCGGKLAIYGLFLRFVVGPFLMVLASLVIGIKGTSLKVAFIQAALPQAVVPFVFARDYNMLPTPLNTLSTAVISTTVISLPVTLMFYVLLEAMIPDKGFKATMGTRCLEQWTNRPVKCYLSPENFGSFL